MSVTVNTALVVPELPSRTLASAMLNAGVTTDKATGRGRMAPLTVLENTRVSA